jgi:adenylate kinase family enzyme
MRRIQIIGGSAAGKSTVSKRLGEILGIDVIHLDHVLWRPGCRLADKAEECALVRPLLERERWIIDGNYTESLPMRLERADTIIMVDASRASMFWGAMRRLVKHGGGTRPSMGGGCRERLDFAFLKWIWRYPKDERPVLLEQIRRHGGHARLVTLRSRGGITRWLDELCRNPSELDEPAENVPRSARPSHARAASSEP